MKKFILLLLICMIIFSLLSCRDTNNPEYDENSVMPFPIYVSSYIEYIEFLKKNNFIILDGSGVFNNITETLITTKEEAIELAKNEVTIEYNYIDVYFDKASSMWLILFSFSGYTDSGQSIYINSNGLTKLINYDLGPSYLVE